MCGTPCPDCPWSLLVLAGKPQLVMQCKRCRTWRHYHLRADTVRVSAAGTIVSEAVMNHTVLQKDINSMLRCDCLAPLLYVSHMTNCAVCKDRAHGALHGYPDAYVQLHRDATLHAKIMALDTRTDLYRKLLFPAYTLQRRCGANPVYFRKYVDMVKAMPDGNIKTLEAAEEWRKKRLAIIEGEGDAKWR